ncbi:MAG: phospho-N-acetylmuramoyl-pentapeptide-transferase [Limnochordia bacterium]
MDRPLYALGMAFAIALLLGPSTIAWLHRLKFGQSIRDDGPQTHLKKSGTPTMGGVLIIFAYFLATWFFSLSDQRLTYALLVAVGYGLIGLIDDFIIVVHKRSLGLRARHKLVAQGLLALLLALFALMEVGPQLLVPFSTKVLTLPPGLYLIFVVFVMVGTANAVNLTDGLDGLAAGTTAIAALAYTLICLFLEQRELAVFAASVAGACLGFSWFNSHPAQVFMGDTGSLSLGGALGAIAVLTGTSLFLPIIGGLFLLETLSVILQVTYFRLTKGKRILRMTPLHHHFELVGWAETKVVTRFWLLALVLALIGLYGLPGFALLD